MKQKLMVVCGGQSSEHIVSRMSCTSVMNNLNKENYDVTLVGIDQDGSWYILDQNQEDLAKDTWLDNAKALQDVFGLLKQQDVVLPILHGAFGEDGTIQGLFELAGVPYVGCRVLASAVSMDKIYTKKILETAGIPQVKSLYVKKRYDGKLVVVNKQFDEIEDIEKTVEGKYNSESKSYVIGITAATKKLTFIEAIRQGINQFIEYALLIFTTLGKLITDLTHTVSQLSGPVGIYTVTAQVTQSGSISTLLSLTALLSTNIGMFNLLPIPGLDGSQLLFALVEKIIRREIPTKMKYALQMAGLILVFGLMIFVTINDIGKFF